MSYVPMEKTSKHIKGQASGQVVEQAGAGATDLPLPKTSRNDRSHQGLKIPAEKLEILVIAAQKGDRDAYVRIYDILVTPLYRYVYYRVPRAEVEDLTELVFLKVWENLDRYQSKRHQFVAWVFRIAHNLIVDYYRVSKQELELDENVTDERREADARSMGHDRLNRDTLKIALSGVKERYRQILILKFIEDLSNEEVAEILGKRESAIRILQFRALKALKKELQNMGISDF